jgi:hypothetical protein
MAASNNGYNGRGIHNQNFLTSLEGGNLNKMLEIIRNDKDLDLQIREDYLNIYYMGGNIAKVNSENSIEFDKFYFYLDMNTIPTKTIKKDPIKVKEFTEKRNKLISKFKNQNYAEFFCDAKQIMDKWFAENPNPERKEQHELSLENLYKKSDYTIIDIEYQVSTLSSFACTYVPNGKVEPKKPRFDIVAITKQGKLCIIELKKGTGALEGKSGLVEHWKCYQHSIARNTDAFKKEMQKILQQKQDFDLIDNDLQINSEIPEFMFAYAYDDTDLTKQDSLFQHAYNKIGVPIHVIKLKDGSKKLMD